jgi:hypothetical protein
LLQNLCFYHCARALSVYITITITILSFDCKLATDTAPPPRGANNSTINYCTVAVWVQVRLIAFFL